MNYKILKNEDGRPYILEVPSKQIMGTFSNYESAKQVLKKLNFGSPFNGWTPAFFLKNFIVSPEKINRAYK